MLCVADDQLDALSDLRKTTTFNEAKHPSQLLDVSDVFGMNDELLGAISATANAVSADLAARDLRTLTLALGKHIPPRTITVNIGHQTAHPTTMCTSRTSPIPTNSESLE